MTFDEIAPAACTLPTHERPLRAAEFDELFARHLVKVEHPSPTRVHLHLVGNAGLAEWTRDLAHRESTCCSFFAFTTTVSHDLGTGRVSVTLDVEVPAGQRDLLSTVADRAESVRTRAAM